MALVTEKIKEINPDIICYTEVIRSAISTGYIAEADADYGYGETAEKRKVVLWSKIPWTDIDTVGDTHMPSGRFVSGVSEGIQFVGICIPWRDAHVRTGRRNKGPWEDHLSYCEGLKRVLGRYSYLSQPICIVGDYNQRIPRRNQPKKIAEALTGAIPASFSILTRGVKDPEQKDLIDHICVSTGLAAKIEKILPRFAPDGTRLSDHVGVLASLQCRRAKN